MAESSAPPDEFVRELELTARHDGHAARAVDLACGTGANAIYLAVRAWQVVAADADAAALDVARSTLAVTPWRTRDRVVLAHTAPDPRLFGLRGSKWKLVEPLTVVLALDLALTAPVRAAVVDALAPGGLLATSELPGGPVFGDDDAFTVVHREPSRRTSDAAFDVVLQRR